MIEFELYKNIVDNIPIERLLNKHSYKIFQSKDGRWRTTLPDASKKDGRKLIAKSNQFDLEEAIIKYYSLKEDKEYAILAFNKNTITLSKMVKC